MFRTGSTEKVKKTHAASFTRPYIVWKACDVKRIAHKYRRLDLGECRRGKLHGGIIVALIGISTTAE